MIERLQRALEHIEELSPEAQEEIAEEIEELTLPIESSPEQQRSRADRDLPKSVRDALAVAGVARALQDDDEFAALDRIRHESVPTPPIELDDLCRKVSRGLFWRTCGAGVAEWDDARRTHRRIGS